jgi:diguanylate cyclase (GGDEF)-like protein/PAS domain S-box-containing protein
MRRKQTKQNGAGDGILCDGVASARHRRCAPAVGRQGSHPPAAPTNDGSALLEQPPSFLNTDANVQLALDAGDIGLYLAERPLGVVSADVQLLCILGYSTDPIRLDPATWESMIHPEDRGRVSGLAETVRDPVSDRFEAEYRLRHRDGHWIWVLDRARVYARDAVGNPTHVAGACIDVSRRKETAINLEYLVDHDELTAVLNRRGIWGAMQRIHAHAKRVGQPYCLAMLDLDHFKQVNDGYGHAVGDRVLVYVAETLRRGLREADWIGRWGGEEFVIVLPSTRETQALMVLERLLRAVSEREIEVEGHRISVTLSAGIAACQPLRDAPGAVLDRADSALFRAKESGRNQVSYSGSDTGTQALSMAVIIQDALRTASILPAFQPVVELSSRRIVGEESLARIVGGDGRVLAAMSFIDVARQLGLLHQIDHLLFRAALRRIQSARDHGLRQPLVFVHISDGLVLRHRELIPTLADELRALADEALLDRPLPVVLNLSERQIKAGTEQVSSALAPLLSLGCRLALADFGGEDSSYRFLTHLPVNYLGIDKGLVRMAGESERARTILAGIQRAAHDLGIITIAKHIEDEGTLTLLSDLGIDWGLGYLFGAPSEPREDGSAV